MQDQGNWCLQQSQENKAAGHGGTDIIVVWGVKTERSGGKDTRTKLKQRSSLDNMGTPKTHVLRLGPQPTAL